MPKFLYYLLFCLFSLSSFSQTVTIKGKIIDKMAERPLEAATVYISSAKDSTMIDYGISDKNGNFALNLRKITQPVFLKVSFVGYTDYKLDMDGVTESRDLGSLYIEEAANDLGEVIIVSEAPPVRIKQDTLEFNAGSFRVRPDANVEALLKQLPGVQVDANGKITHNGKEVDNVLVNGKPFFGKDGKVAVENLPASIINKVQVTDTKTKEEELAGQAASSENKTINLTIQEDKNKGLFGKFSAGRGSDDRYEASALMNYFKDKRKISFLGSSNNINSIGFSMDEVFDAMGGGRNVYYSGSDGGFNIDGQQFGGGNGITLSNMIGINYADEIGKVFEPTGSYFFTNSENKNRTKSRQQNLQNNSIETGENTSRTVSNSHNLNVEFEVKIDSMTTLTIRPNLRKSNSHFTGRGNSQTVTEAGVLQNDMQSFNNSVSDNASFTNDINFYRKFKKKGRGISFWFQNSNSDADSDRQTISETNLFQDGIQDLRNQIQTDHDATDKYDTNLTFNEPITDSLSFSVGSNFMWENKVFNKKTFDFDAATNEYSDLNDVLSNYITSAQDKISPFLALNVRKKKLSGRVWLGSEFVNYDNFSSYMGDNINLDKSYVFPKANGYLSYRMSKSKSVYMNYNYSFSLPSATQLIPVANLSNPLNTITGNPDLDPMSSHRVYFGYNNYDFASKSGFYVYAGGSYKMDNVVSSTVYDENARRQTSFENVDHTYDGYMGMSWDKSFKKEQNTFRYSLGINTSFARDKGFVNSEIFEARRFSYGPQIELSYEYGELLTITPTYDYNINKVNYQNYTIDGSSNFVHELKLQMTSYWPKNFVFGNDIGYTYNSDIADGFKKDFYLWNASLGYNFYKDKFLAKVKVYDILNQNVSARRTISADYISDVENTVLQRYVMFSLTYKIEKFGGKAKPERRRWH